MNEDVIVEIGNSQDVIDVTDKMENIILDCVNKALDMEGFDYMAKVSIILVDNPSIQEVNSEYRGIDRETDVLSFPMLDLEPGHGELDPNDFINDVDPDTGAVILGDIMISLEKTGEQAKEYGHSFERELGFLTVHGMLHLLGYDHMDEEDKDIMRAREETILGALNLIRE